MGIFSRYFGSAGRKAAAQARQAEARKRLESLAEQQRQRQDLRERQESEQAILEAIEHAQFTPPPAEELSAAEAWANSGEWFDGFASSNVRAFQYDGQDERLVIEYKDGSFYAYHPVRFDMAVALYDAPSKGTWVWDHLRVRGTVFGYQVPYELFSGSSAASRDWMRTEETRRKHGHIPPSGRDWSGRPIRPRDVR